MKIALLGDDEALTTDFAAALDALGYAHTDPDDPDALCLAVVSEPLDPEEAASLDPRAHELVVWPRERDALPARLALWARQPGPWRDDAPDVALDELERFRIAAESANDLIYEWDMTTGAVHYFASRAGSPIPTEALVDRRDAWEERIHPDDRARVVAAVERHVADGVPFSEEYRYGLTDGLWRSWSDRGRVLFGLDGRPTRMIGACADVTARRVLEERLGQSQKMEAVGRLAGGVAHDFNNLLLAILNNIDYALEAIDAGPVRRDLEDARKAAERGADLTRQLLAFSRRQVMRAEHVSLNHVIVGLMRMLRRVLGPQIRFVFKPGHDSGTVLADTGQLEQILVNLVVNARDAMPDGGKVTVATGRKVLTAANGFGLPAGDYARLVVADTGEGIPPEVLPRVFEPFFTTKDGGRGTGLGLPTVYGIVQQHGGAVRVESTPEGTGFELLLPIVDHAPAAMKLPEVTPEPPGGHETILVAEDNPHVRDLTIRVLSEAGYRVIAAEDGVEACELFDRHQDEIALVLLDVVMPRMGGRSAHDRIREQAPEQRFAFVSGYSTDVLDDTFLRAHDVRLLGKPYRRAELLAFVREELDRPRA